MRFGEKLLQARVIDSAQLDAGLRHQAETGQRLGEALLELGYIGEETLLRFLAQEFGTRFVSTQKLAKVSVSGDLLERVPQKFAEEHLVFPVLYDESTGVLGIVSCEPQDQRGFDELRILSGAGQIQVFVALREAIQAALRKHYKGDIHAFAKLDRGARAQADQMLELLGDTRQLAEDSLRSEPPRAPRATGPVVSQAPASDQSSWTRQIEAVRGGSLVSDNDFIETLNILVGLVEVQRNHMAGHSARVARLVKQVSERMGLPERDINHHIIAAYLHDLGKRASVHLTLLSIAAKPDHRERAQRYHLTPARLFDSVHLPPQVNQIVTHLYECWDGSGLPEQLREADVPLGAQIIAAADAFEDLTQNPSNHLDRQLSVGEAVDELGHAAGSLLSPEVVEQLREVLQSEAAEAAVGARSPLVLVADRDQAATAVLELKLTKKGYRVRVARDSQTAEDILLAESVSALVVDMRLEPADGFALQATVRKHWPEIPVFMTAAEPPPQAIDRAFEAGAADFLTKPYVPEVLLAKLHKELTDATRSSDESKPAKLDLSKPIILGPGPGDGQDEMPEDGEVFSLDIEPSPLTADHAHPTHDPLGADLDHPDLDRTPTPLGTPRPRPAMDLTGPFGSPNPGSNSGIGIPDAPQGTMAGVVTTSVRILSGTLEGKRALALIKALSGKRKTGMLSLRAGDKKGTIYFEKGHIFQAILGEVQAEEAFLELASLEGCLYKFDPSQTIPTRTIKTSTGKLIQIAGLSE